MKLLVEDAQKVYEECKLLDDLERERVESEEKQLLRLTGDVEESIFSDWTFKAVYNGEFFEKKNKKKIEDLQQELEKYQCSLVIDVQQADVLKEEVANLSLSLERQNQWYEDFYGRRSQFLTERQKAYDNFGSVSSHHQLFDEMSRRLDNLKYEHSKALRIIKECRDREAQLIEDIKHYEVLFALFKEDAGNYIRSMSETLLEKIFLNIMPLKKSVNVIFF